MQILFCMEGAAAVTFWSPCSTGKAGLRFTSLFQMVRRSNQKCSLFVVAMPTGAKRQMRWVSLFMFKIERIINTSLKRLTCGAHGSDVSPCPRTRGSQQCSVTCG